MLGPIQGIGGQNVLTVASEHGDLTCVAKLLADERTKMSLPAMNEMTALFFACSSGYDDIVKELPSRGACNAVKPGKSGAT